MYSKGMIVLLEKVRTGLGMRPEERISLNIHMTLFYLVNLRN